MRCLEALELFVWNGSMLLNFKHRIKGVLIELGHYVPKYYQGHQGLVKDKVSWDLEGNVSH